MSIQLSIGLFTHQRQSSQTAGAKQQRNEPENHIAVTGPGRFIGVNSGDGGIGGDVFTVLIPCGGIALLLRKLRSNGILAVVHGHGSHNFAICHIGNSVGYGGPFAVKTKILRDRRIVIKWLSEQLIGNIMSQSFTNDNTFSIFILPLNIEKPTNVTSTNVVGIATPLSIILTKSILFRKWQIEFALNLSVTPFRLEIRIICMIRA